MGEPIDKDEYCAQEDRCIPLTESSNILGDSFVKFQIVNEVLSSKK